MPRIAPLAETADTVTLSRRDYERLLDAREDAIDLAALRDRDAREAEIGSEAYRAELLTLEEAERLWAGESPVRVWREKRGLTPAQLAKAAGLTNDDLNKIENGEAIVGGATLPALATALNVDVDDLQMQKINQTE